MRSTIHGPATVLNKVNYVRLGTIDFYEIGGGGGSKII